MPPLYIVHNKCVVKSTFLDFFSVIWIYLSILVSASYSLVIKLYSIKKKISLIKKNSLAILLHLFFQRQFKIYPVSVYVYSFRRYWRDAKLASTLGGKISEERKSTELSPIGLKRLLRS